MKNINLTWLGHGSFRMSWDNTIIFFDPWIDKNPTCTLKLAEISQASAVCVTHGHDDHIGDSIQLVKKTGAKMICSPEIAIYSQKKGIKPDENSYALNTGGSYYGEGYRITMTFANHTSDILGEEYDKEGRIEPGSGCCGYVLQIEDGPAIYFSGDTDVFGDMAIIRELYGPDVAIVSCGGRYTMGYRGASLAASLLCPQYFIPMHHSDFPFNQLDFDKLETEMKVRAPKVSLVKLKQMDSFIYE